MTPPAESGETANGIPRMGLGTWKNSEPATCADSVATALDCGYRHIDTAQVYGNEAAVGKGIKQAAVDRDDIFLATKVWIDNLSREDVIETTNASLERLGVDSVELLYIHWPARTYEPAETLAAFNELYDAGKINHIGVSNFQPDQLREAVERSAAPIVANQFECHPLLQQQELRAACAEHDVDVVAYSPLARGDVFDVPVLQEISDTHDATPAQISLAWLREAEIAAIPKATGSDHIQENWASLSISLSAEEQRQIREIETEKRLVDPAFGPWN